MPGLSKLRDTGCPIAFALDTFGDRWSLLIIRDILMKQYRTYGEYLGGDEQIATSVLADKLQDLELSGVIEKARDPDNGRRFLYRLTEKGADLAPVLLEMIRWSGKYDANTIASKAVMNRAINDAETFSDELRARSGLNIPDEHLTT